MSSDKFNYVLCFINLEIEKTGSTSVPISTEARLMVINLYCVKISQKYLFRLFTCFTLYINMFSFRSP